MELDKLSVIRNWKNNPKGESFIQNEIENYSVNYDSIENTEFLQIAYEFVVQKNSFEGIEYRFLCWLNYKYGWKISIKRPHLTEPSSLDIESFKIKYLFSEKRRELFKILTAFLAKIKVLAELDTLTVIVGASFTEESLNSPNDFDCIILLNESYLNNFRLHENYLRECKQIPQGIDMHFLPENYTLSRFKAFSHIIYLGNKAKFKDGIPFGNNEFEKRKIIKITL